MTSPALASPSNPFIGPRPFEIGERLFGRDWETGIVNNLLLAKRLVLLHAPSGAGKTSLVQAALWPLLNESFALRGPIRVNTSPPKGAVGRINRYEFSTLLSLDPSVLKDPTGRTLAGYSSGGDETKPELWFFDQFEEVVSLDPTDGDAKLKFFKDLAAALSARSGFRAALFAMRDDYLGPLEPYLKHLPTGLSARFHLERLDEEAARQAIGGIAATGNGLFEPKAIELLIDELLQVKVQEQDGREEIRRGTHIEPMQLQVVGQWLWDRAAVRASQVAVTLDDLIEPGEVSAARVVTQALAGYYTTRVNSIGGEKFLRERAIRDWFERQLIIEGRLRSQAIRGQERNFGVDDATVKELIKSWLVREEPRGGRWWLEISHDRLVAPIVADNAAWRADRLSPMQKEFERWRDLGRPADGLLGGAALKQAEEWVRKHVDDVTEDEHDFLDKSQAARRQAEREQGTALEQTGWGVVFPAGGDPAVRAALRELLDHRRRQAGTAVFREMEYRPGETPAQFLARYGAPEGQPDPEKVPYYLLLAGDPSSIPFELQYGLDLQYAVGRLSFRTPIEYARYARSVVAAETGGAALPPRAAIWAPQNADDQVTRVLHEAMIKPLLDRLARAHPAWAIEPVLGEAATRTRLAGMLNGPEAPALLFAAGHGIEFNAGDSRQQDYQGSLICQDWPGPRRGQTDISREFLFASDDVGDDARLLGMVAFLSGGSTGGTPQRNDYAFQRRLNRDHRLRPDSRPDTLAPQPFVAHLAQRLLGHPAGGALAVIGHVDRSSLIPINAQGDYIFAVLKQLMAGQTVGRAMEAISQRYSQLSAWLGEPLRDLYLDYRSRDVELDYQMLTLLTSAIDARNFILAGDPAVRLPVDLKATASARPALGPIEVAAVPGPATTPTESVVADACALFLIEVTPSGASSVAASIPARASDVAQNAGGAGTAYRVRVSLQRPNDSGAVNFDAVVRIDLDALSAAAPDPVTYGRLLGRALLGSNPESGPDQEGGVASPVATLFAQARGLATTLNLPLRVQLAIGAGAPELHGLRWETLRDPETDTPLLAEKTVLFSRFVRSGQWRPARVRQSGDSRALVFVSNPSDLVRYRPDGDPMLVDVADEIRRVREVLAQVAVEADSNMPGSSGATADLLLRLLRDPYDILYLVAHSAIEGAEPYLYLEDESGRSQPISGLALAQLFADLEEVPQLVVLSPPAVAGAASEAEAGDRGELVRLGVCLAEAGVPAVLAMQGRVMLGTAQEFMPVFMHKFLRELRRDGLLDRAMTAARAAVIGRDDWWMPVLFLRSRTSRLFGASVPQFVAMPAPLPEGWMRTAALDRTIAALTGTNGTNLGGTGPGGLPASDWAAQTGPLARTMALSGLSGYGKSTVARAAYNDPRVAWAFPIRLWITLGPSVSPATLADGLRSWVSALGADPTAAAEVSDLSAMLRSLLASTRALLAIDDISDAGQLALFLVGGKACTHLVTTRDLNLLPAGAQVIEVGQLEPAEAVAVLGAGLDLRSPGGQDLLAALAARLGYWPVVLGLANGLLRERVIGRGQGLADAVSSLNDKLESEGITAFDSGTGPGAAAAIESGLEGLAPDDRRRLEEMSIFPEGIWVPQNVVEQLWKATAGKAPSESAQVASRLAARSLVGTQPELGTPLVTTGPVLRLHPVLRQYLSKGKTAEQAALHEKFLNVAAPGLLDGTGGVDAFSLIARQDVYLRKYLTYHLVAAGRANLLADAVFANGVDGVTGDYIIPPLLPHDLARQIEAIEAEVGALSREERQESRRLSDMLRDTLWRASAKGAL